MAIFKNDKNDKKDKDLDQIKTVGTDSDKDTEKKDAAGKGKETAKAEKKSAKPKPEKKPAKKPKKKSVGIKYLTGFLLSKMAKGGAAELRNNAEAVNRLNVFPVPDGDTGDNMRMTIESGIAAIENMETDNLADVMKKLAKGMLLGARGNSGVILSQFFAGMAKGLEGVEKADPATLGHALELGVAQAYSSVMTPTEGTILTVAREAVEFAVSRIHPQSTIRTFFADLVQEMYASLERTPDALTVLREADVVDSGGAGLFYIMDGFNRVLNGKDIPNMNGVESIPPTPVGSVTGTTFGKDSKMTYGYCTEALLQLQTAKCDPDTFDVEPLKEFLASIGDSIVAFKTDSIVKLHVHTFTPEKVLEYCRRYGEFLTVKIENMSVQHTATELDEEEKAIGASNESEQDNTSEPKKPYGVVAVCNGEGLIGIFSELGADEVVVGGQTHNPSAGDFLEAFARINAECIYVFPNNGNIQMAAAQAAEMYEDAKVYVVPSKSIGKGYVALASANLEGNDPETAVREMEESMNRVSAGYVSPSIRDADIGGIHINDGDTIGIIDKEIVVAEPDRRSAALALAARLLDSPERYMLTVFCGKDAEEAERVELNEALAGAHPNIEIYVLDGGQDIYPYIFVAE